MGPGGERSDSETRLHNSGLSSLQDSIPLMSILRFPRGYVEWEDALETQAAFSDSHSAISAK